MDGDSDLVFDHVVDCYKHHRQVKKGPLTISSKHENLNAVLRAAGHLQVSQVEVTLRGGYAWVKMCR